jgi:hypothetical protein
MPEHEITVEVDVKIVTTDEGEQGMRRFIGLDEAAAHELGVKPHLTWEQIQLWLASSLITSGRSDAGQDGFADLDRDAISVYATDVREY